MAKPYPTGSVVSLEFVHPFICLLFGLKWVFIVCVQALSYRIQASHCGCVGFSRCGSRRLSCSTHVET